MKTFNVRMTAFMESNENFYSIRKVKVDSSQLTESIFQNLDKIFVEGQNDFNPVKNCCSVSTGDVIEYDQKLYCITSGGFVEITEEEFNEFMKIERRYRPFHNWNKNEI